MLKSQIFPLRVTDMESEYWTFARWPETLLQINSDVPPYLLCNV